MTLHVHCVHLKKNPFICVALRKSQLASFLFKDFNFWCIEFQFSSYLGSWSLNSNLGPPTKIFIFQHTSYRFDSVSCLVWILIAILWTISNSSWEYFGSKQDHIGAAPPPPRFLLHSSSPIILDANLKENCVKQSEYPYM